MKLLKEKWFKILICLVLCFTLTITLNTQNTYAVAGVDDLIIMTLAGMLLTAAGITVTDPNNQESISGETGKLFSSVFSIQQFLDDHFYKEQYDVASWLIQQGLKYSEPTEHEIISVWNNSTSAYTDVEVVSVDLDENILNDLYVNDWFTNYIDSEVVSGSYSEDNTNFVAENEPPYTDWEGYPDSPELTVNFPLQIVGEYESIPGTPYLWLFGQNSVALYKSDYLGDNYVTVKTNGSYTTRKRYRLINGIWTYLDQNTNISNGTRMFRYMKGGGIHDFWPSELNTDVYNDSTLINGVVFAETTPEYLNSLNSTLSKTKTLSEVLTDLSIPSTMYIPTNPDVVNEIAEGVYDPIDIMTNSGAITADIPISDVISDSTTMDKPEENFWDNVIGGLSGTLQDIRDAIDEAKTAANEKAQEIADTITGKADLDPNAEEKSTEFKLPELFRISLIVLIATIRMVIRAIVFISTFVLIPANSDNIPPGMISGLDFYKNLEIPNTEITVWDIVTAILYFGFGLIVFKAVSRKVTA